VHQDARNSQVTFGQSLSRISDYYGEVDRYLKAIGFYERVACGGGFSDKELKAMLYNNLKKYLSGAVSQDFVIGLGDRLYDETIVGQGDETLLSALCQIDDLAAQVLKQRASHKESDKVIRHVLKALEKECRLP
jgi:hypothetical protein